MTTNDLVYKIGERLKYLGDQSLPMLRSIDGEDDSKYKGRGELLERIITDEFIEEHPKEIVE